MAEGAIIAAVIGAASTVYASETQKSEMRKASSKQEEAAAQARAEELRILKETGPDQGSAQETIKFGVGGDKAADTYSSFLVPKSSALGSASTTPGATSGLGFNV